MYPSSWLGAGQTSRSAGRMCICFSIRSLCHLSESIPTQSLQCLRMTFQLRCHFYWFSCCVEEGEGGWGDWERVRGREREREREGEGELAREGSGSLAWSENGACLCFCLVVFFKWPSNPAAVGLLFPASLSAWQQWGVGLLWLCSGCLPVCWKERRRWREEGERKGGGGSLWSLADIPVSSPKLLVFFSQISGNCFAKIWVSAGFAPGPRSCCSFRCDWIPFPPSPTPQQHKRHLHILRLPNLSVIQDFLIDKALVYLADVWPT